ncbi:MAG: hypothetical protein IPH45_01140 [Bacteroidales bacterium]|nr:hypothetical protein [Bacteroidales bacterium]
MTTFRNYWSNYLQFGTNPKGYVDFYEPRIWGWKYVKPASMDMNWRIATDTRKAFRLHNSLGLSNAFKNDNFAWFLETTARMRFSDKFTVSMLIGYDKNFNDYGWVQTDYDSISQPVIRFGRRDVTSISNILNLKYIFNTKMSLNLRGRHYWSRAEYFDFYTLQQDGSLKSGDFTANSSLSFNVFTADLQYVWYFAPGSEISLVWKNYINTYDDRMELSYREDLMDTLRAPQANSFSVRILYYIDYTSVRSRLKKS